MSQAKGAGGEEEQQGLLEFLERARHGRMARNKSMHHVSFLRESLKTLGTYIKFRKVTLSTM